MWYDYYQGMSKEIFTLRDLISSQFCAKSSESPKIEFEFCYLERISLNDHFFVVIIGLVGYTSYGILTFCYGGASDVNQSVC